MNENNKKRSSANEYLLLNNIYDECLTYLGDLKDNVKKIISSDEENQIDFIDEATVVEMMNQTEANDDDGLDDDIDDEVDDSHDDVDDSNNAIEVSHDDLDFNYGDNSINVFNEDVVSELMEEAENNNHHINEAPIKTEFIITNEQNTNRGKDRRRISLHQDLTTSNNINTEAKTKSFSNEEITTYFKEDKLGDNTPLGGSLLNMQHKSARLRKFSRQLPKIIITQSNASLQNGKILESDDEIDKIEEDFDKFKLGNRRRGSRKMSRDIVVNKPAKSVYNRRFSQKVRTGYGNHPERLVSKSGVENVALISNVPFEKIRLLNDTFHTLINLRWRWIVSGTIVVHFAIWFIFAIFWYISALAHYDFEPNPPKKTCITGGTDFVTIFLASVEAQTTIGFGDRTIDEECPESIFLFVMQLILGTGCSGVLTCVVYAKLTRPEKLSRDGVGFSKNAVICLRDGMLCLMIRAWDLNYDHIIGSQFSAHFVHTHRTKEGEVIRYYSRVLKLEARQFLLWPVTLIHFIDKDSALYNMSPETFANNSYEIVVSLKGASASMGTFTQSQTSYLPKEILWGYKFPSVVRYDHRKQKYVIEKKRLNCVIPVEAPNCSAQDLDRRQTENTEVSSRGSPCGNHSPSSFSETVGTFHLERTSSFRKIKK